ncbi:MAG: histidinol-phosphatase [Candidatus Cloacimonadota bacterium]|nr:MAG: histidinol-phosphatase [Candidatus Cloacimonadota bacterium]PIE79108.1 MAG: histidinol-phosphatase [Candidatus Delongbacteria bacterium]
MIVKADLHMHTVLSPCGDLDMGPVDIVKKAKSLGLNMIAITDHNTTIQAEYMVKNLCEEDLLIIGGVEINSKEDVHALALFEDLESLRVYQKILESSLPEIINNPDKFGYQVAADKDSNIIYQEEKLLISALSLGVEELGEKCIELGGIFIPAHIDRRSYSIISQLGFISPDLKITAVELSYQDKEQKFQYFNKGKYPETSSSDAHYIEDIGRSYIEFEGDLSFQSLKKAIEERSFVIR